MAIQAISPAEADYCRVGCAAGIRLDGRAPGQERDWTLETGLQAQAHVR